MWAAWKSRLTRLFAPAEDPRREDHPPAQRQRGLLERLGVAIGEIRATRSEIDERRDSLVEDFEGLWREARARLIGGDETSARRILERRAAVGQQIQAFEAQVATLTEEEARLRLAEHQLIGQMEEFRFRKEVISAREAAAEAQVRITEALAGISNGLGEDLERAELRTQRLQARSAAIESLKGLGALGPLGGPLSAAPATSLGDWSSAIDEELACLREEVGHG